MPKSRRRVKKTKSHSSSRRAKAASSVLAARSAPKRSDGSPATSTRGGFSLLVSPAEHPRAAQATPRVDEASATEEILEIFDELGVEMKAAAYAEALPRNEKVDKPFEKAVRLLREREDASDAWASGVMDIVRSGADWRRKQGAAFVWDIYARYARYDLMAAASGDYGQEDVSGLHEFAVLANVWCKEKIKLFGCNDLSPLADDLSKHLFEKAGLVRFDTEFWPVDDFSGAMPPDFLFGPIRRDLARGANPAFLAAHEKKIARANLDSWEALDAEQEALNEIGDNNFGDVSLFPGFLHQFEDGVSVLLRGCVKIENPSDAPAIFLRIEGWARGHAQQGVKYSTLTEQGENPPQRAATVAPRQASTIGSAFTAFCFFDEVKRFKSFLFNAPERMLSSKFPELILVGAFDPQQPPPARAAISGSGTLSPEAAEPKPFFPGFTIKVAFEDADSLQLTGANFGPVPNASALIEEFKALAIDAGFPEKNIRSFAPEGLEGLKDQDDFDSTAGEMFMDSSGGWGAGVLFEPEVLSGWSFSMPDDEVGLDDEDMDGLEDSEDLDEEE